MHRGVKIAMIALAVIVVSMLVFLAIASATCQFGPG